MNNLIFLIALGMIVGYAAYTILAWLGRPINSNNRNRSMKNSLWGYLYVDCDKNLRINGKLPQPFCGPPMANHQGDLPSLVAKANALLPYRNKITRIECDFLDGVNLVFFYASYR